MKLGICGLKEIEITYDACNYYYFDKLNNKVGVVTIFSHIDSVKIKPFNERSKMIKRKDFYDKYILNDSKILDRQYGKYTGLVYGLIK